MSLQKYVFTYSKMFRLIRRKKCKEKSRTYMITTVGLGWASLLGKDRSFTSTNGIIKNDPIVQKKTNT